MISPAFVQLAARYNAWQNTSLVAAGRQLPSAALIQDRRAFFGSILGTACHIFWADRLWLSRLAGYPAPEVSSITESTDLFAGWEAFAAAREALDRWIIAWAAEVVPDALAGPYSWHSGALGREVTRDRGELIVHMFNHQTHHRGQIHAMLTAAGGVPDDTDIPFMPDQFRELSA